MIEVMVVPMTVSVNESLTMSVNMSEAYSFELGGCVNMGGLVDHYEGAYTVTPKAHTSQTLETANKYLTDNVLVLEVPYYETSNTSGMTAYIADEV